jgi:AraC-like DNA-binding protein
VVRGWSGWRHVPDPHFGLRAALLTESDHFDLVVYLARSCSTAEQALRLAMQYAALLDGALTCRLEMQERGCLLSLGPRSAEYLPAVAEYLLLRLVLVTRKMLGADVDPIEVHFAHRRPRDPSLHRKVFRSTVRFGLEELALVFRPGLLERPMPGADPVLRGVLQAYAEERLHRAVPGHGFARTVRDVLTEMLASGFPSRADVAERLGIGGRTLARRLEAEATTYSAVVDEVRMDRATKRLCEGDCSLGALTAELGFSDQSAFTKFFKRRAGVTPSTYRRKGPDRS